MGDEPTEKALGLYAQALETIRWKEERLKRAEDENFRLARVVRDLEDSIRYHEGAIFPARFMCYLFAAIAVIEVFALIHYH